MAVLVNPATGERFEGPDDQVEAARQGAGLVTEQEYAEKQQAQSEGPLVAAARSGAAATLALPKVVTPALAKVGLATDPNDPNLSPEARAYYQAQQQQDQGFFRRAQAAEEAHPVAGFVGKTVPMALTGALAGGVGAGLLPGSGAAAGLLADSALQGTSQEAVDAVTAGRDFSAKGALMNGVLNLAIGGVAHVGLGALAGGAERAAMSAEDAGIPKRNWLGEVDPGEVPEARTGGTNRRAGMPQPESAGAAASSFDDLDAAKAIKEIVDGKVKPGPIAEAAPAIREQLSVEGARDLDFVNEVLDKEAGLAAKNSDFAQGAAEWTPEMVEKQNAWLGSVTEDAGKAIDAIDQLPDAKGVGRAARESLESGLRNLTGIEGAERNVAIDSFKRNLQKQVMRVWSPSNAAIDGATREAVARQLQGVAETVRQGLLDEGMFGRNARVQAAHNEPLHEMIDALGRVQKKLYETTGRSYETGMLEKRADPDALRRLFEDPHLGGKLFQKDLAHVLDQAETLGRNRLEHGLSNLERLPEFVEKLQSLRDDLNTAQVLQVAESHAGGGAHGFGGASPIAALGSNALVHAAEFGGRAVGFPLGNIVRSTGAYSGVARSLDRLARKFGGGELAKAGTATRSLLDRYAARVKGSELLGDAKHAAGLPEGLKAFLDQAHAPTSTPRPPTPGAGGAGGGEPGAPVAPPGSPANDVRGKVAALAAVGGAGALLAPGQASAAELLPDQQQNRDAFREQLAAMPPDQQQRAIATAQSFARIQKQTESRVKASVSDLFALAKDPKAEPRYRSPQARQLDQRAAELDVPRHLARFMGKHDDPIDAWQDKSRLITALAADPSRIAATMAQNLGDLPHDQPEIFASMVGQTAAAVQYLAETRPDTAGKSAVDPQGYPPSFEEISEWAGRWVGALHPLDSLDDLASNELVPEQIEAVQALHPEAYTMFQTTAMAQIHELSRQKKVIPLEALEQIDAALDLDGAGEPILSSGMAKLLQQAGAQEQQRMQQEAQQERQAPMVSKFPSQLASSALGSLHGQ